MHLRVWIKNEQTLLREKICINEIIKKHTWNFNVISYQICWKIQNTIKKFDWTTLRTDQLIVK